MRKWVLLFIVIAAIISPLPAFGQEEVVFNSISIDIRPEYDRTEVLVMYDLELPQTAVGSQMSLRIPAAAGAPFALAYGPGDGTLFDLQYERQVSGNWAFINFSPPMSFLRLEYYDPSLQWNEDTRSFNYTWPGDYATGSMTVLVMQPYGASQMQISPGQWETRMDNDGLTFFGSEIGQVPAGEEIQIKISYQKTSNDLTTEHLLPQPSGAIPDVASSDFEWQQFAPWILGILGTLMLGGGLVWYWQTGRRGQLPAHQSKRHRSGSPKKESRSVPGDTTEIYCHQCGKRASASDSFCRSCGTRLRPE